MATLIIGAGNDNRGDDAVGLIVVRRLRGDSAVPATLIEVSAEGIELIEALRSADNVVLIDAVYSGAAPGTIYRLEAHTQALPSNMRCSSTHALGVAAAIELARALGQLPARLIVYGIEGRSFTVGDRLSPEVERAIQQVLERLRGEIRETRRSI